jgi:hypothetical protein
LILSSAFWEKEKKKRQEEREREKEMTRRLLSQDQT